MAWTLFQVFPRSRILVCWDTFFNITMSLTTSFLNVLFLVENYPICIRTSIAIAIGTHYEKRETFQNNFVSWQPCVSSLWTSVSTFITLLPSVCPRPAASCAHVQQGGKLSQTDPHLGRTYWWVMNHRMWASVSHLMTSQAALVTAVLGWVGLLLLCQRFLPSDYIQTPTRTWKLCSQEILHRLKSVLSLSSLYYCLFVLTRSQSFNFTNDDPVARCCGEKPASSEKQWKHPADLHP